VKAAAPATNVFGSAIAKLTVLLALLVPRPVLAAKTASGATAGQ